MAQDICPLCEGSGWKRVMRGEVSGVERCECALENRTARLLEQRKAWSGDGGEG